MEILTLIMLQLQVLFMNNCMLLTVTSPDQFGHATTTTIISRRYSPCRMQASHTIRLLSSLFSASTLHPLIPSCLKSFSNSTHISFKVVLFSSFAHPVCYWKQFYLAHFQVISTHAQPSPSYSSLLDFHHYDWFTK